MSETYKEKKVITIGIVSELTGLSPRKIRYYEDRKLIFPERTKKGTRKYSFSDIEILMDIANKIEEGVQTFEIRKDMLKRGENEIFDERKQMIQGQINSHFKIKNNS